MLITIFSVAEGIDKILFYLINHDSESKYLDPVMIAMENPCAWIPLYLFMFWYSIKKMPERTTHLILLTILVFAVANLTCNRILNPIFERTRPCNNPELLGLVRTLVNCGGGYSFPSNHALQHFGLATFWFCYIKEIQGKRWYWLWGWAAITSYTQIYVGKHYPSDIITGGLLGMLMGYFIFSFPQYIRLPFPFYR